SFTDLIDAQCIEQPFDFPWRIEAHVPVDLNCESNQFSLVFTSSSPKINTRVLRTVLEQGSSEQFFVEPQTGIMLHNQQCTGSGNVTVFTGAGSGEEESRFPIKSWRCIDLPDWIVSFENVITVGVEEGLQLTVDYAPRDYMNHDYASPLDRVAVMSSGRSDNL
ncbi:hypothetical protein PENTCL1PPCAC_15017, partial [Pristionchus entomophagus]